MVTICFKDAPFDALVDMSANYSMIDSKLCEYLHLDVTPFQYDVPYCMGIEGACMTRSIMAILGWVELQVGIPSLGLATIRLWVADTMSSKGTPFILGSNQITKIFSQVNTEITNSWPQPWRSMHYRYVRGNHWCNEDAEDLYDSDAYDTEEEDSFDLLCQFESQLTPSTSHSSLESWLEQIDYPAPSEELASKEIVTKVAKGIPDKVFDVNGNSPPAAQEELNQPIGAEQFQNNGGGELSVFTNLASESEGLAAEDELPVCNIETPAPSVSGTVKLAQYPTVSCKIAPSGETTFNLHWANQ